MTGVRCTLFRGGTSKGAFFLAEDLPADPSERDDLLLRIMGSPDPRQIDGLGGAQTVTSKVAVVSRSQDAVDYLFLQVGVEEATVSDKQNCGNLLAAVGPFAVERGLVEVGPQQTAVRINMVNTGSRAVARFATPGGRVDYTGDTAIDGVPGTAAPIALDMADTAGSTCGRLLPTGNVLDDLDGVPVTCIDNGMPVVVVRAADLGATGYESPAELAANVGLNARVQALRGHAARLMGLDGAASVPKISLIAAPRDGGAICTRTFIPVRPHPAIGVLGAVSVLTAVLIDGAAGHELLERPEHGVFHVEHPTGALQVDVELDAGDPPTVRRSTVIRTARPLFDGVAHPRP